MLSYVSVLFDLFERKLIHGRGWSVYTSDIAMQTPCYTSLSLALTPPTAVSSDSDAALITTALFSTRYILASSSSGLSAGTVAGITIGAILAALLAAAAILFIVRRRQAHQQALRDATVARSPFAENSGIVASPSAGASPASPCKQSFSRHSAEEGTYLSELATPMALHQLQMTRAQSGHSRRGSPRSSPQSGGDQDFWRGPSVSPGHSPPISPPIGHQIMPATSPPMGEVKSQGGVLELPGSTYIHEHHPMYSPEGRE